MVLNKRKNKARLNTSTDVVCKVSIFAKGEKRSRNLANSQRAEKSKNSPLIDGYYIFLLLLLLLTIKAFSIHQLLILRFVEVPRLCYSANLAYKQFMLVLNRLDSSGFVKLAFFL